MNRRQEKMDALLFPLAAVIMAGWVASLSIGFYTGIYLPLTVTTPLMLMLAGGVLGINIIRRNNGG